MKRTISYKGWSFLWMALGFVACNDDVHDYAKQTGSEEAIGIYVADSVFTYSSDWTIEGGMTRSDTLFAKFPVCLTEANTVDVVVSLILDDRLVEAYNVVHNTMYKVIPAGDLTTSNMELTIRAGETESRDSVTIAYTRNMSWLSDPSGYLIPLRIRTYQGAGVKIDYNERHSYLIMDVNKPNRVSFKEEGVKVQNILLTDSWTDLNTVSVNLLTDHSVHGASSITVSVRNDLIDALNDSLGTDYLPIPVDDLTQTYQIALTKGKNSHSFTLAYSKDKTTLNDPKGYMIPLEITAVEGKDLILNEDKTNFLVRLDVDPRTNACEVVNTLTDIPGAEIADRSGYTATAVSTSSTSDWSLMFDGNLTTMANPLNNPATDTEVSLTIDLGADVENITGLHFMGNVRDMMPAMPGMFMMMYGMSQFDVACATEELYADGQQMETMVGAVVPTARENTYIKFYRPFTARYIKIYNMKGWPSGTPGYSYSTGQVAIKEFYICTQP